MKDSGTGSVIVSTSDHQRDFLGLLTHRDIVREVASKSSPPLLTPISQIMSRSPMTIDKEESLLEAAKIMSICNVNHIPVTSGGKDNVLGILAVTDVMKRITML